MDRSYALSAFAAHFTRDLHDDSRYNDKSHESK